MTREELQERILEIVDDAMDKGKTKYRYEYQKRNVRLTLAGRIMDLVDEWKGTPFLPPDTSTTDSVTSQVYGIILG